MNRLDTFSTSTHNKAHREQEIPFPEFSHFWMDVVRTRKYVFYKSKNRRFIAGVREFEKRETDYEGINKLYEMIVGELLRIHMQKNGGVFYFASKYDDVYCGVDYIISLDGIHYIGVDLCVTFRLSEDIKNHPTVERKVSRFNKQDILPEEFVATVGKGFVNERMPLIILQINKEILDEFIQDFFATRTNFYGSIQDYYKKWIVKIGGVSDRVADIIGIQKEGGADIEYIQMMDIIRELTKLLEGESDVFIRTGSHSQFKG